MKQMNSEHHLQQLLRHKKLKLISNHLAMVRSVQKDLERVMPERFRGKFRVIRIESSTLILSVRSSILATQMRLIVDELIRRLQNDGNATARAIKRIKIRMKPVTVDLLNADKPTDIPKAVRRQMAQLAARLQDKKLAMSLNRLSQTGNDNTQEDS